jgi:hypothetical protein
VPPVSSAIPHLELRNFRLARLSATRTATGDRPNSSLI